MPAMPMPHMRARLAGALTLVVALAALGPASVQAKGGPEHFGQFEDVYSFIGFECDGFDILIEGTATTSSETVCR